MSRHRRKYSLKFWEEAVKMVIELSRPVADVARELGINEGTLGSWVNRYRKDHPEDDKPLTVSERARLRELEREDRSTRKRPAAARHLAGTTAGHPAYETRHA